MHYWAVFFSGEPRTLTLEDEEAFAFGRMFILTGWAFAYAPLHDQGKRIEKTIKSYKEWTNMMGK